MVASVIIIYHPDNAINNNLDTVAACVDKLYIVDNTEYSQISILASSILQNPKVEYLHSGKNEGIALPLNRISKIAKHEGFELLLTMDQDSFFEVNTLKKYLEYAVHFKGLDSVGMFGVNPTNKKDDLPTTNAYTFVRQLITSGSLMNLIMLDKIGGFDEQLFIDQVDSEYCFKILEAGLQLVKFNSIYMTHQLGIVKEYTSLKSLKKTSRSLHSPVRIYYMLRNYLYLSQQYSHTFPVEMNELKADIFNRIKNNFIYGAARWKVLQYILRAVIDFKKGKMGKIAT